MLETGAAHVLDRDRLRERGGDSLELAQPANRCALALEEVGPVERLARLAGEADDQVQVVAVLARLTRADEDAADHPACRDERGRDERLVAVVEPRVPLRDLLGRRADDDLAAPDRVGERRLHLERDPLPGAHRLLRIPLARDQVEPTPVLSQRVEGGGTGAERLHYLPNDR